MFGTKISIIAVATLLLAATASALPIVFDGYITDTPGPTQDFYVAKINDVNELDIPDNLDIKSVRFDIDDAWFYMGLEVYEGPLSLVGDPTSFRNITLVFSEFIPGGTLDLVFNAGGLVTVELNGGLLAENVDYEYMLGDPGATGGLEMKIKKTTFGPMNFDFFAQLDDNGSDPDDQVVGKVDIPEPMTLVFVALGLPIILTARRQHR